MALHREAARTDLLLDREPSNLQAKSLAGLIESEVSKGARFV
jgi:hypothetical protein